MVINILLFALVFIGTFYRTTNGLPIVKNESVLLRKLVENPDLFEGDIVLPPSTGLSGRGVAQRGWYVPWENGIVPYEISKIGFGLTQQAFIVATMQKMERIISINNHKCIQFRPKNASDSYFITIVNGNGCYSSVGQNTGWPGGYDVSLQNPGCLYEATIMHELLHTLGFYHEQSRPDRDSYVRVNYGNIPLSKQHNFNKYANTTVDTLGTPYDYSSVMHYERDAFSSNGLPTIEPLQPNVTIGQRYNMSTIDIEEVRILYNCSTSGHTLPPIPPTITVNLYRYDKTVSSTFTSTSNIFEPYGPSVPLYYEQYLVNVYTDDYYLIRSSSVFGMFGFIYVDSFDPVSPSLNLMAEDNDGGGPNPFILDYYLQANKTYILVAATFSPFYRGPYSVIASGYDVINITKIDNNPSTTTSPTATTSVSSTTRTTITSGTTATNTSVATVTTNTPVATVTTATNTSVVTVTTNTPVVTTTTAVPRATTSVGISNFSIDIKMMIFMLTGLSYILR